MLLLVAVFLLFLGRKGGNLKIDFQLIGVKDLYFHVSNFCISYLLFSGIGMLWLMAGVPFRFISIFGIVLITVNIVYELWIPVLNTPDILDACYGIAGTLMAGTFLLLLHNYGLKQAPDA